jgi:hypothetical protein
LLFNQHSWRRGRTRAGEMGEDPGCRSLTPYTCGAL